MWVSHKAFKTRSTQILLTTMISRLPKLRLQWNIITVILELFILSV